MTQDELRYLVEKIQADKCESSTLELKSANKDCPRRLYDTLSSFSNQDQGGTIVFGIDEQSGYHIVGVYDPQDIQKKINEQCLEMEPTVRPLLSVLNIDGKFVVSAEIPSLDVSNRPCYYKGAGVSKGSYVRVGDSDEPMTAAEIFDYEAFKRNIDSEANLLPNVTDIDINQMTFDNYVKLRIENKPNYARQPVDNILKTSKLKIDGKYTVLSNLLFGFYPEVFMSGACINAVVIPGISKGQTGINGERFIDNQCITGTIEEQLTQALHFIDKHTASATIIDPVTAKRNDRAEYPKIALREAILNALEHRDYSKIGRNTPISIEIYYDRIEISNPGGLFGRFTIDKAGLVTPDTRNPELAGALSLLKLCERRYSGIPTIEQEIDAYGLVPAKFEVNRGTFKVTFYNTKKVLKVTKSTAREKKVLDFCKEPKLRAEICKHITLSSAYYVENNIIAPLLKEGLLEVVNNEKSATKRLYRTVDKS